MKTEVTHNISSQKMNFTFFTNTFVQIFNSMEKVPSIVLTVSFLFLDKTLFNFKNRII